MKNLNYHGKNLLTTLAILACLLGISVSSNANNLNIGTPSVVGNDLTFTISWDNSWFTTLGSNNYDAVWIFVKRQSCTDNLWVHAPLSTNSADHSVTGGLVQVDAVADGMGIYIRRFAVGAGAVPTETVTIALQTPANTVDNYQIHGVEMVFAPQGAFGIGNAWDCQFAAITIDATAENSGLNQAVYATPCGTNNYFGNISAAFPVGFNAFYAMKYEISQDQYAAFLNTLTFTQQSIRMTANPNSTIGTQAMGSGARSGLRIQTPGVVSNVPAVIGCDLNGNNVFYENADGQNIACNFLNWGDLVAYLDWAGMRPMTEFEYEKLCRGTEPYFPGGEYAWGSNSLLNAQSGALTNAGTPSELSTAFGAGLCAYQPGGGPLRCGFAAGLTTRAQAGAGFYGNMELSGNLWEFCIGGGNTSAGSFFGTVNGNGNLLNSGFADVGGWPVNGVPGYTLRGGAWTTNNQPQFLMIGNRSQRNSNPSSRNQDYGGRGVRSF